MRRLALALAFTAALGMTSGPVAMQGHAARAAVLGEMCSVSGARYAPIERGHGSIDRCCSFCLVGATAPPVGTIAPNGAAGERDRLIVESLGRALERSLLAAAARGPPRRIDL